MPRLARVVIVDHPHHVIHRGNRRENVFFSDTDKQIYVNYLKNYGKKYGIEFWAYCIMDNHVHFIAVPRKEDSFARGFAQAHKDYTRTINFRNKWCGHLWEGRFKSCVLSEQHLYRAVRYVERNPVRAKIVKKAEDYRFSSAKAHVHKTKDDLLTDNFVHDEIKDWKNYLLDESDDKENNLFVGHVNTGRPLGDEKFIEAMEEIVGRVLKKKKAGRKKGDK